MLKPMSNRSAKIHVSSKHRLDLVHAMNVSSLKGVTVHKSDFGGHGLVRTLRDRGEFARLFGSSS